MARLIIEGGHPLAGSIRPTGNKNAAMPMMCAALLTDQPLILHNVPRIGDVHSLLRILRAMGVESAWIARNSLRLQARALARAEPPADLFGNLRGSLTLMGPLLARAGEFRVAAAAGGDDIGRRRIDTHLQIFRAMGVEHRATGTEYFCLQIDGQPEAADIWLDEASVTATENGVMLAALARGTTVIYNAACEPHVSDLCRLLVRMGCPIEGVGTNRLIIPGRTHLAGTEYTIGPDYMEIGSYLGLGAITRGRLCIQGVVPEDLRMIDMVFRERLGVRMSYQNRQDDGRADLIVEDGQTLTIHPDYGSTIPRISSAPWPGFPTDLLSIALVVATQARGTAILHEKMFESRLYFVDKLIGMGAQIVFCDPHRAVVAGPSRLYGQTMSSPDIRAGMALILAALCAEGTTELGNVGVVDRGYSDIDRHLAHLGAQIQRLAD